MGGWKKEEEKRVGGWKEEEGERVDFTVLYVCVFVRKGLKRGRRRKGECVCVWGRERESREARRDCSGVGGWVGGRRKGRDEGQSDDEVINHQRQ